MSVCFPAPLDENMRLKLILQRRVTEVRALQELRAQQAAATAVQSVIRGHQHRAASAPANRAPQEATREDSSSAAPGGMSPEEQAALELEMADAEEQAAAATKLQAARRGQAAREARARATRE